MSYVSMIKYLNRFYYVESTLLSGLMLGLDYDSPTWCSWMFTDLLIFFFKFIGLPPKPPCTPLVGHVPHFVKHRTG